MITVTALADEMLSLLHDENPLLASLAGIPGHARTLPDLSTAAEHARRAGARRIADHATTLTGLAGQDALTRAVVAQQATAMVDRIDAKLVEYTVAFHLTAPAGSLLHRLSLLRLAGADDEQDYLARLTAVPRYLEQAAERHRAGIAAGRLPLAHLARAAVATLDRQLADRTGDPLRRPAVSGARVTERDKVLEEVVRPAFARYRDVLDTEVVPSGRPADRPGLCWLPDGESGYAAQVRMHTTTERSPEDLHQTGLDLVARLAEEYVEIGSRAFGASTVAEVHDRLRTDPALRWQGREELLSAARETVERAEQAARGWFGRVPTERCVVEPVADTEAPHVGSAYYIKPALDGSRPGTYVVNAHRAEERDRFSSEALAFHEAVPGHHFQLALAQQLDNLPLLRRLVDINAYVEGWALYSERLADEMGLYSSDITRLGMLAEDSLRAARLVVDTGIHAKGWSRQQVVDYLRAHSLLPEVDVQTETDRYIEWPGQALSYMVGRLEIQRLRAAAERELGAAFDRKAFHDVVLGGGSLPMTTLAEVVDHWISVVR